MVLPPRRPPSGPYPAPLAFFAGLRILLLLLLLATPACTVQENPVSGRQRAYGYTWEQEKQLGQESAPQITAQYGRYGDEALNAYVDRVGQRVLEESHLRRAGTAEEFRDVDFTFSILDSPVVNAFALPGGYVYVTRGLLAHLNNEAQLAVVLGHEIAHVAARHASQQAAQQQLAQIGLIGGALLGQKFLEGTAAQQILGLGSQAMQLLFLRYSRDHERESDALGVEYAALAGYEASEGSAFFRVIDRIGEESGHVLPSYLSTHPDPEAREERVRELAAEWAEQAPSSVVGRGAYLNTIADMVIGDDPDQGFVEGSVFYHPELRFRFPVPQRYQLQNTPRQVVMLAPEGEAVLTFSIVQEASSAEDAAASFIRQHDLRVVDEGTARVDGLPAAYVLADAQTQEGTPVRLLAYYVERAGRVYTFFGYAAQDRFRAHREVFLNTVRGFRRVDDPAILNAEPARLRLVRAERRAAFRTFLPERMPRGFTEEEMAIMNQVTLDEVVEPGRPLKLPDAGP